MESHERRRLMRNIVLPTELVKKQVLDIFQDMAIVKGELTERTTHATRFFLLSEIAYMIERVWEGDDQPSMEDIEFFLEQAVAASPTEYKKHARMGYTYLYRRDH